MGISCKVSDQCDLSCEMPFVYFNGQREGIGAYVPAITACQLGICANQSTVSNVSIGGFSGGFSPGFSSGRQLQCEGQ